MNLSKIWVEHSPDFGVKKIIFADETCICGVPEKHKHCACCGKLVSRGSGEVVASYRIDFGRGTFKKTKRRPQ